MPLLTACLLAPMLALSGIAHAAGPATQPVATTPDYVISDVRVQTIAGFTFLYDSTRTSFQAMSEPVERTIAAMEKAITEGKIHPSGPLVFVYRDLKDPNQPFTLDVGFGVPDDTAAFGNYQVRKVEPFKCATVLFSGPLAKVPEAYNKLMGALPALNLKPTTTVREFYLYWETPDSQNNIVQIQVGVQ
ncbi:MAG TPA: GyrI-like domain-containing protein [Tepidisphaeraceae bacterium]|jgi:effector-binding domain-containing protein